MEPTHIWLPEVAVALEAQTVPAILLSPTYEVLLANTAYLLAFGGGVVGRSCYEVSHHYDSPCDEHGESCPLAAARSTRQPARVLHVHQTPRGPEHVDVTLTPVRDAKGEMVAYIETLRPVEGASAQIRTGVQVGRSRAFNESLALALRAAPARIAVLLLGESGTGKERMARVIHEASPRQGSPFVAVACAGLSESLFEAELFGHEKGAFTGATHRRPGLVESAAGGTLFLDEIGDVPLQLQIKLLRLLEARHFRRVGGTDPIAADFRLICATWRDLDAMVAEGAFRRDLYYRLAAFPIHLPALRDRIEDLPLLAGAILEELGVDKALAPDALARLRRHDWPGNVRELRNALQRAALLSDGVQIEEAQLALVPGGRTGEGRSEAWPWGDGVVSLKEVERRYLRWCVRQGATDRRGLARQLGVSERTLFRKLAALDAHSLPSDPATAEPPTPHLGKEP